PGVLTEIAVCRASGDDEVVVWQFEPISDHLAPRGVDPGNGRQQHLGIELVAENSPYGDGNVSGRQARGRNLVKQWLEEVVVLSIDECDASRGMAQRSRASDATEPCSDDHYTGQPLEVKSP